MELLLIAMERLSTRCIFPTVLKAYPFQGDGVYLLLGKITEEFGQPSLEVEKMARLGYVPNPGAGD